MRKRRRKPVTAIIISLYLAAAAVLLLGFHPFVHALGKKSVTLEIGAEGDHVKAVLSRSGVLTISGSGKTEDYTEETAPFAEYADQISSVVIRDGVTSIGDYLLYNCGDLKGTLTLPQTVVWIGDGAFSGEDYESAPKFTTVVSEFVSAEIGRLKPGAELPETETAPESTATPGNAGVGPGETTAAETTPSEEADPDMTEESSEGSEAGTGDETESEPSESKEESSQERPGADTGEGQTESGSGEGTTGGNVSGGNPSEGGADAEESKSLEHPEDSAPDESEARETDSPVVQTDQDMKVMGSVKNRQNMWFKLSTPSTAATGSDALEEDSDHEEQDEEEETEEDSAEGGELSNDLYEDVVLISSLDEASKGLYTREIITTQIVGTDVFLCRSERSVPVSGDEHWV